MRRRRRRRRSTCWYWNERESSSSSHFVVSRSVEYRLPLLLSSFMVLCNLMALPPSISTAQFYTATGRLSNGPSAVDGAHLQCLNALNQWQYVVGCLLNRKSSTWELVLEEKWQEGGGEGDEEEERRLFFSSVYSFFTLAFFVVIYVISTVLQLKWPLEGCIEESR